MILNEDIVIRENEYGRKILVIRNDMDLIDTLVLAKDLEGSDYILKTQVVRDRNDNNRAMLLYSDNGVFLTPLYMNRDIMNTFHLKKGDKVDADLLEIIENVLNNYEIKEKTKSNNFKR